jgi:DNA-directed RNA polymerase delta subunit
MQSSYQTVLNGVLRNKLKEIQFKTKISDMQKISMLKAQTIEQNWGKMYKELYGHKYNSSTYRRREKNEGFVTEWT